MGVEVPPVELERGLRHTKVESVHCRKGRLARRIESRSIDGFRSNEALWVHVQALSTINNQARGPSRRGMYGLSSKVKLWPVGVRQSDGETTPITHDS